MINVGIIGTGRHGSRYANHILNDIEELHLVAISRRSANGADQAKAWGAKWFSDWREMIHASEIGAIISVVPPVLNLAIARECALAGKPLLLEKPLAINSKEAIDIVNFMSAENCPLTVGQTLRYNQVIKSLKSDIESMGKIYSIHANQRIEPSTLGWHDDNETAGYGVSIHTAVHVFDALHFITGLKVTKVMASSYRFHNTVLEDLITILFEMENGIVGTVDVSKVGDARSGRFEFICSKGQLIGEQIHGYTEIITKNSRTKKKKYEPIGTIAPLLTQWTEFLQGKGKNPIKGKDGMYAVRVCEACLQSSVGKAWVNVSSNENI